MSMPQPLVTFATKAEYDWVCGSSSSVDGRPSSSVAQSPELVLCLLYH